MICFLKKLREVPFLLQKQMNFHDKNIRIKVILKYKLKIEKSLSAPKGTYYISTSTHF